MVNSMFLKRGLTFLRCRACQLAHFSSSNSIVTSYEGLILQPKFSQEEQDKILNVLNKYNTEQLSRFDVSQARIKNLQVWRHKKGPFKTLADVLEVDGLGLKVLERLCKSIITDDEQNNFIPTKTSVNNGKNRKQFLSYALSNEGLANLKSAVALHLRASGISWTKISKYENRVNEWGFYDFSSFPKKMLPNETFHLAMIVLNQIPLGDVYIFESPPNGMASGKQTYNHQLELNSMLFALINTSPKHSLKSIEGEVDYANNVYYLRPNLSAKFFRTLVGSECVSSTTTISKMLDEVKTSTTHSLPCSSIKIEDNIMNQYFSQNSIARELLGQSLMLAVTFMELCVYKNQPAIHSVTSRKKDISL